MKDDPNILSDNTNVRVSRERLRWACRRGMLELDCFLLQALDKLYDTWSLEEQNCFYRLLQENDQDLYDWLLGQRVPQDVRYEALCRKIRNSTCHSER